MQKALPEPQVQGSPNPQSDEVSQKLEDKMRLLARHILDEVIENHRAKLAQIKDTK